jgi:membrane associated rhomboid family serine protease
LLILPLDRKPTRETFPLVTAALVLANIFVFVALQGSDREIESAAADRYIESGMLELEWGWFSEWAEFTYGLDIDPDEVDQWLPAPGEESWADRMRLMMIDSEPGFHRALESGVIIDPASGELEQWRQARAALEAEREESFTRRYLLRYDQYSPGGLFMHMFMHGGVGHLVGNMLFLVLIGLLLEPALGAVRYLVLYLVAGLGSAGTSLAVNWGMATGSLGASGAIAGLMGAFAVVYGLRKVRFFYWAFVYFDYVRAPALVLLPLWLGWELLAWMIHEGSNIAYEAHAGGMVSGALLGLLAVWAGQIRRDVLDAPEVDDVSADRQIVAAAEQALDDLEPSTAKRLLRPLLSRHADETRLWSLYFAACRLRADDPDLDAIANRILRMPGNSAEQRELIIDTFSHYRRARNDRPKLPVSVAVALASRLARWGDVDGACFLVDLMSRSHRGIPGLGEAAGTLAQRLEVADDQRARHYRQLAQRLVATGPTR